MADPIYRVLLIDPTGNPFDVSDRISADDATKISETTEETLAALTHADMSVTLKDPDRFIRRLFGELNPEDYWQIVIERETLRRRPKWERIFGGVLDFPWSIQYEPKEDLVHVQAFSYSKYIDVKGAEELVRSLTLGFGSATAASNVITIGSTTGLLRGDHVQLDDGSQQEEYVVDKVSSATQFLATKNAEKTFASGGATATLLTPFYRFQTPAALIALIGAKTRLEHVDALLTSDLTTFPVATPMDAEGTRVTGGVVSLTTQAGKLTATYAASKETKRKLTTGPTAAWTDGATSNVPHGDWTPYRTTEPATIKESSAGGPFDDGRMAWDHDGGHVYYSQGQNSGFPAFLNTVHLIKDGVDLGSWGGGAADPDSVGLVGMDYDPVNARVWGSTSNTLGDRRFRYYDGSFHDFDLTRSGQIRCCRRLNRLVFLDDISKKLRFYDLTTLALVNEIDGPAGDTYLWTLRTWSTYIGVLVRRADGVYLVIWDSSSLALVVDQKLTATRIAPFYMTVMTLPDGREAAIASVPGEWFVISRRYDGVIPYANFEGMSCASALRDIAIILNCYISVDADNLARIQPRAFVTTDAIELKIADEDVLDRESFPIWENWRTAAKVEGKDDSGNSISVVVGHVRDESRTISISSPLINSFSVAVAIGTLVVDYLSKVRREEQISIRERGQLVRPLKRVRFDGINWLCIDAQSDLQRREQGLRLVEAST